MKYANTQVNMTIPFIDTVNDKSYARENFCGLLDFYHNVGKTFAVLL